MKLTIFTLLLTGCGLSGDKSNLKYEEVALKKTDEIKAPTTDADPAFTKIKSDVLTENCIGCHNPDTQKAKGRVDLTDKKSVFQNSDIILYLIDTAYVNNGSRLKPMPLVNGKSVQLSPALISEFKNWKESEEKIWADTMTKSYKEAQVYDYLQKNLFETSCVRCHNANNTKRVDLTKKENIVDAEVYANILCSIKQPYDEACEISKMPPKFGDDVHLKQELVEALENWKKEYDALNSK